MPVKKPPFENDDQPPDIVFRGVTSAQSRGQAVLIEDRGAPVGDQIVR